MFPLVTDSRDVRRAREEMRAAGLDPEETTWGTMIETPASALTIGDIVESGVDFVSFGTNDLTQYTLAVDRNNERIADRYDATHPAVLSLITRVVETCREHGVKTSICGEAGSDPEMIEHLVTAGIDSISVNVDAVGDARKRVAQVERQQLLGLARDQQYTTDQ
jgi:pyruvate,water dikinase